SDVGETYGDRGLWSNTTGNAHRHLHDSRATGHLPCPEKPRHAAPDRDLRRDGAVSREADAVDVHALAGSGRITGIGDVGGAAVEDGTLSAPITRQRHERGPRY